MIRSPCLQPDSGASRPFFMVLLVNCGGVVLVRPRTRFESKPKKGRRIESGRAKKMTNGRFFYLNRVLKKITRHTHSNIGPRGKLGEVGTRETFCTRWACQKSWGTCDSTLLCLRDGSSARSRKRRRCGELTQLQPTNDGRQSGGNRLLATTQSRQVAILSWILLQGKGIGLAW